ncbi:MAG: hypothetical protein HN341_09610 [Verrucomicrobia bacterium]|jgi:hypothetical protein|nr:hypothetical protein [Verrucomicrobiota bacterium]
MKPKSILTVIVVVAAAALLIKATQSRPGRTVPEAYRYSIQAYEEAERTAARLCDERTAIPLALLEPRALATGPDGCIAAIGDRAMLLLDRSGRETKRIALEHEPTCVAWADVIVYVGFKTHIEVFTTDGECTQVWQTLGENAWLTGLTSDETGVYAADYGQRTVWKLDNEGRLQGRIDGHSPDDDGAGFVTPSPFFDVVANKGVVWITNPGRQRVEEYDIHGTKQTQWGHASTAIDGFCGCCNPTHLARLRDGRFITSEKGMPRVKLYSPEGDLLGAVALSTDFREGTKGLDLATDGDGRILVLEPQKRRIRIFEEKAP